MSELTEVELSEIDPNPHRLLDLYPLRESKIETLQQSIEDVGFWPVIIARRKGNRFELAFGHHRLEAARRNKLKKIPLIVKDLNDEQMLQIMAYSRIRRNVSKGEANVS